MIVSDFVWERDRKTGLYACWWDGEVIGIVRRLTNRRWYAHPLGEYGTRELAGQALRREANDRRLLRAAGPMTSRPAPA